MPPTPPKIGPCARRGWDHEEQRWVSTLTAEGNRFADAWYATHGSSVGLLIRVYGPTYGHARRVGLSLEDIESACRVALVDAVRTYDPAKGAFSTHLANWLRNAVLTEAERRVDGWSVQEAAADGEPTDSRLVLAQLPAPADEPPDDTTTRRVAALLGRLTDRQRAVIERRYGLDGRGGATLAATGVAMGVSKERARQLEAAAVQALRRHAAELEREGRA